MPSTVLSLGFPEEEYRVETYMPLATDFIGAVV